MLTSAFMKRIGIVGGLGPEATIDYYRTIIKLYRKRQNGNQINLYIVAIYIYVYSQK